MGTPLADNPMRPAADGPVSRYRAVSSAAVASLVLGALSALTVLGWPFFAIPTASVVLGWRALKRIARSPEELTGTPLAWSGIGLAGLFVVAGVGWLMLVRAHEVPHGYQRVEYAQLQPNPEVQGEKVPPAALELDNKKVFIRGYIIPGRQQIRLKAFQLCPTNGVCPFHFQTPRPTEVVRVKLTGDLVTDYTTRLIGVGGRMHVDPEDPHGLPYRMDGDCLR